MKQTPWEESVFQVKTSLSNCLLVFQFFFLLGVILGNSGPLDQSKCAVSYHLNTIFGVLQLFCPHPVMVHFPPFIIPLSKTEGEEKCSSSVSQNSLV